MRRSMAKIAAAGVAAAVAVGLVVGLPATPAAAHAELVASEPASGDVLDAPPEQVVLEFTEGVQIGDDVVEVFDSSGDRLDLGEPVQSDGGSVVTVGLPGIGDGAYVVTWRVTSSDSHPIHGAFTFRVGEGTSGEEAEALMARLVSEEGGDTLVGVVYGLVRWVGFAGAVLLVGGAAFVLVLWPSGRRDPRARGLVAAGWWLVLVTTLLSFGLQAAYAASETLDAALDPALIGDVLGTRAGQVWLVRLALLAVVAVAGWRLVPRPRPAATATATSVGAAAAAPGEGSPMGDAGTGPAAGSGGGGGAATAVEPSGAVDAPAAGEGSPSPVAPAAGPAGRFPLVAVWRDDPARVALVVALGLALLATISVAGHAGAGDLVPLALVVDVLHLAAMSFWLGGLTLLLLAVLRRPVAPATAPSTVAGGPAEAAVAVHGFSTLAFASVVVLVVTGTIQGWRQTGALDAVTGTTYGRLLLVKVGLVALMLAAAAVSRRWVQRRSGQANPEVAGAGGSDGGDGGAGGGTAAASTASTRGLRRSVGVEVAVAVAVLGLTALLVNTVPGVDAADESFSQELHGTDLLVRVELEPAATGPVDLRIQTLTHAGEPVEPEELTGSLTLAARDIGPIPLNLEPTGEGRYRAAGADIPFPGTWELEVEARISEFEQDSVRTEVPVG